MCQGFARSQSEFCLGWVMFEGDLWVTVEYVVQITTFEVRSEYSVYAPSGKVMGDKLEISHESQGFSESFRPWHVFFQAARTRKPRVLHKVHQGTAAEPTSPPPLIGSLGEG